ncbi:IMP cyclohydrolase [Chakrabartyella piscis]|uniref:IMP cyclohydrolase n=1 Tax=Chakrabartyella piscis TaxID=2918914 RepID=UPI002F3F3F03
MGIYDKQSIGAWVSADPYVGRGIVIGKAEDGKKAVFGYFIMGRSENSRNRVFVEKENDEVMIYPHDESKVEDPSLIIYSPIKKHENKLIVTNGDQTDTIYNFIKEGKSFEDALDTREFEPDAPNLTPRISGMLTFGESDFTYKMSILKSADAEGTACNRYTYSYPSVNGLGHFIHTYAWNADPLPTFQGEPKRVAMVADIDAFTADIWENLNAENKISLYVRYVDLETGAVENRMINKNQ